jgi:hypothetical protein
MLSRRTVLSIPTQIVLATTWTSIALEAATAQGGGRQVPEDELRFIEWMDDCIRAAKPPSGMLTVGRFSDAYWYLTRSIEWTPLPGQQLPSVKLPVGFVTDFASIPRVLWSTLPRDGDYVWAAVIHDYLYWNQETTRDVADDVFNAAMVDFKIPTMTRVAIYRAVQLGGEPSWRENAALKLAGEKRTIKLFPPNPTISWADWKMRPDVF